MKIFVISPPEKIQKEHEAINALFEEGLEYFHLRKPEYSEIDMASFLKDIKPKFLKRVSIHSHYRLIEKYNLRGIHLTNKYLEQIDNEELKEIFKLASKKNLQISTSIHHPEDLKELKYNYIFLSPVFDSISKSEYKSSLHPNAIEEFVIKTKTIKNHPEIIALGGIEENKIEKVTAMGFDGFALLGTLWSELNASQDVDKIIKIYKSIKLKCQTAGHMY